MITKSKNRDSLESGSLSDKDLLNRKKSTKERAQGTAEKLTRRISPSKTKLPIISRAGASKADPFLQLMPSGIVLLPGTARPVFLLKHEASGETLPVWMHPLDASVGLNELGQGNDGSPHSVARQILEQLAVTQIDCYFTERIGHHQYVQIHFVNAGAVTLGPVRVRADEVMSFCIATKARFFSTKNFIAQCRVLNEELEKLQEGLLAGTAKQAFPELEIDSKKSGYVM
jgi:hypothetical protein